MHSRDPKWGLRPVTDANHVIDHNRHVIAEAGVAEEHLGERVTFGFVADEHDPANEVSLQPQRRKHRRMTSVGYRRTTRRDERQQQPHSRKLDLEGEAAAATPNGREVCAVATRRSSSTPRVMNGRSTGGNEGSTPVQTQGQEGESVEPERSDRFTAGIGDQHARNQQTPRGRGRIEGQHHPFR